MKNWRKTIIVLIILAVAMPGLLFAGGRSSSSSSGTVFNTAGAPRGYAVPVSQGGELTDRFSIFVPRTVLFGEGTMMQTALKEKTGIDYIAVGVQSPDLQTHFNLMLASRDELADLIIMPRSTIYRRALIESGKVLETSFLYSSPGLTVIPNIAKKIKDYITEPDGKIWVIPGFYAWDPDDPYRGNTQSAFWVRTDLMQQAGVTEQSMATIAGFEDALRRFRTLRNPAGQPMIPLSFRMTPGFTGGHQEKQILAAFGVDMSIPPNGMVPVMEINGRRVFAFDNPDFLEAYKWMNRMYNEGLIDLEVATQSADRFQEKLESGQFAAHVGDLGQGRWDYWLGMNGPEDGPARWYMTPFQSPAVPGKTKQFVQMVNGYPGYDLFINANTRRLNAVMNYLEWAQEHIYYRRHEVENGPLGTTWDFTDAQKILWQFEPVFGADRWSGDSTRSQSVSPQVWNPISYGKSWYPWDNVDPGNVAYDPPGNRIITQHMAYIGDVLVNHRVATPMDLVQPPPDSIMVDNLPTLNQVYDEYSARMIMARNTAECESLYQEFLRMLETRARWSQMKAEWERLYAAMR